jgi:hypothetical protein
MEKTKLTIRLYPGQDDDLIAWLSELRLPHGQKGDEIKNALRRGIGQAGTIPPAATLDASALLADIRQVVEAALQSAMLTPPSQQSASSADKSEQLMSKLDQAMNFDLDDHW